MNLNLIYEGIPFNPPNNTGTAFGTGPRVYFTFFFIKLFF